MREIPASTPLPEPEKGKSKLQKVNALAFGWFIFFLFGRHLANFVTTALCGCFSFCFKFFKVLVVSVSNDFFAHLFVILLSSLYLLRQFISLDRDYFTKYDVAQSATMLYAYDMPNMVENKRTVAKRCSNKFMSRGQKKTCNVQNTQSFSSGVLKY